MENNDRVERTREELEFWEMVKETTEQESQPGRNRIVVRVVGEYHATHRWEINPDNGWVTVQLRDGSILPTKPGDWCLFAYAESYFGVDEKEINIDDPRKSDT